MRSTASNAASNSGARHPNSEPCKNTCSMFARAVAARQGGAAATGNTGPVLVPIEDAADPRLADYVDLTDVAARQRREGDEFFIAEGPVAIERLLQSDHRLRSVLVSSPKYERLAPLLDGLPQPVYVAATDVLKATVGFDIHRGAVAVGRPQAAAVARRSAPDRPAHRRARRAQRPREPRRDRPIGAGVRDRRAGARPDVHRSRTTAAPSG